MPFSHSHWGSHWIKGKMHHLILRQSMNYILLSTWIGLGMGSCSIQNQWNVRGLSIRNPRKEALILVWFYLRSLKSLELLKPFWCPDITNLLRTGLTLGRQDPLWAEGWRCSRSSLSPCIKTQFYWCWIRWQIPCYLQPVETGLPVALTPVEFRPELCKMCIMESVINEWKICLDLNIFTLNLFFKARKV